MSGNSHAKKVQRTKELDSKKRGQIFSKMARLISVAAREGGSNPEANPKLKAAIEAAKNVNIPKENIERAVARGLGRLEGEKLEEILFEAYGPGGVAIIIEGITDNKNRALGEIKQALAINGGKLVGEGGVKWMFERKITHALENSKSGVEWAPKQEIEVDEKTRANCEKLFEALDELDSVQEIYSNIKT